MRHRQSYKNNKIRILYLLEHLSGYGGTETHVTQVVTKLDRKRFLPMVCFFVWKDNPNWRKIQDADVLTYHLPFERFYDLQGLQRAWQLANLIRRNRIDIVQTFHFIPDTYGTVVSRLAGARYIISSRRDMDSYKTKAKTLMCRSANRFINHFIAVCDAVGQNFSSNEAVPPNKISRIYNGIDLLEYPVPSHNDNLRLRNKIGLEANSFVIGNVSRFRPEKGHHVFFDALKRICPHIPNLKVILVGDGPLMDHFKNLCSQHKILRDATIFTGAISNVKDYISVMDIACFTPNKNEGFSNAILEKMALGKPVIATDVGGNAEAVVHDETGLIVPPDAVDNLAQAILTLYRKHPLREAMGKKARVRVEQHFTIRKMIDDLESLYLRIYNGGFNFLIADMNKRSMLKNLEPVL